MQTKSSLHTSYTSSVSESDAAASGARSTTLDAKARQLALALGVLFVPVLTLWSQIVGHRTTTAGAAYLILLAGLMIVGRRRPATALDAAPTFTGPFVPVAVDTRALMTPVTVSALSHAPRRQAAGRPLEAVASA